MSSSELTFRFLSQKDMVAAGVNDMARCIDVMEESFSLVGQGDYVMGGPTRNSHGMRVWFPAEPKFEGMPRGGPDQRFMGLPGYLGGRFKVCGNKWYGSSIHNPARHGLPRSILLMTLNNAETGAPLAIMAANLLSAMRTGAVVGLAARHLAPDDSKTLGVVAAGPVNRYSTMAIARAMPTLEKIVVYDINADTTRRFIEDMGAQFDVEVTAASSMLEAVEGMDIVTAAISGDAQLLFEDSWLKEGSLLALPGRADVEGSYLLSSHVVPDCWKMQKTYYLEGMEMPPHRRFIPHGRLHGLVVDGQIREDSIQDLGQIIAGNAEIDKNSKKRKYFISNGMITQDIAWAMTVYERAVELDVGQKLVLFDDPFA